MSKYLIVLILLVTSFTSLFSNEVKSSDSFYIKGGVAVPPGHRLNSYLPIPTIGIGRRHQMGYHGYDLSLNFSSVMLINSLSAKGMYLYYPFPNEKYRLYLGAGPGVGYNCSLEVEGGFISLEGVIGVEFQCSPHFKPFVQLEATQPVCSFYGKGAGNHRPGVALTIGVGF